MNKIEEAFYMFLILGECHGNYRHAARMFSVRFPDQPQKSHMSFHRLKTRFLRSGSIHLSRNKPATVVNEENEINVMAFVMNNPHAGCRQISRESGVSVGTVINILHKHKFHPYHMSLHQDLRGNDFMNRVHFCNWVQRKMDRDPLFLFNVMFSDECTFKNTGELNRHNMHYWSQANPHWMRQIPFQHPWSLNAWCGIVGDNVIGPYFFNAHLNGEMYSQFLLNELPLLLEDVPLQTRQNMWMQHDGAPSHNAAVTRLVMNQRFRRKWIGRGGPVNWPARSPDLTSLDFFLWGFIKERVMSTVPTTLENMMDRIRHACAQVTPQMLANVRRCFQARIMKCIEVEGNQFEHLIGH